MMRQSMRAGRGVICISALLLASAPATVHAQSPAARAPAATSAESMPPEFRDSYKAYMDMKAAAHGGVTKTATSVPDWSGIWTRGGKAGLKFDPAQPAQDVTTAKLTPEYETKYHTKVAEFKKGNEWDQLSYCLPAGYPRWLTEPFLREFIVTPKQTWWINEQQSEARRIYTDGRGHVPDDEAFPLWEGDSIGFWDGDTLVVHTIRVKPGQYQRLQPDYSDKTSTVERIRMINPDTIEDAVTVWDPEGLSAPWHVVDVYTRVKTEGARIDMWSCEENNNVVKTGEGGSQFILPGEKGYKPPDSLLQPKLEENKK